MCVYHRALCAGCYAWTERLFISTPGVLHLCFCYFTCLRVFVFRLDRCACVLSRAVCFRRDGEVSHFRSPLPESRLVTGCAARSFPRCFCAELFVQVCSLPDLLHTFFTPAPPASFLQILATVFGITLRRVLQYLKVRFQWVSCSSRSTLRSYRRRKRTCMLLPEVLLQLWKSRQSRHRRKEQLA